MSLSTKRNVILFGASGVGKSSIVNMLSDSERAPTSNGVRGCTFDAHDYDVNVQGRSITLWDTPGLNEGEEGHIPNRDAIVQLYKLLLSLRDGVSLLAFVVRSPRLTDSVAANWRLFREIICQGQVPAVVIVTGLEEADDRNQWWLDHKASFERQGVKFFAGFACITATKGKKRVGGYAYGEEYVESREQTQRLILSAALENQFRVEPLTWFKTIAVTTKESGRNWFFSIWFRIFAKKHYEKRDSEVVDKLKKLPGFSEEFVQELRRLMI